MEDDLDIYGLVAEEIKAGIRDDALWLKCMIDASGSKPDAEVLYAKLRVEQLRQKKQRAKTNEMAASYNRAEDVHRAHKSFHTVLFLFLLLGSGLSLMWLDSTDPKSNEQQILMEQVEMICI